MHFTVRIRNDVSRMAAGCSRWHNAVSMVLRSLWNHFRVTARAYDESMRNRFLYYPLQSDLRQLTFRLRIGATDVTMHSGEPELPHVLVWKRQRPTSFAGRSNAVHRSKLHGGWS